jgi:hypothetical protein
MFHFFLYLSSSSCFIAIFFSGESCALCSLVLNWCCWISLLSWYNFQNMWILTKLVLSWCLHFFSLVAFLCHVFYCISSWCQTVNSFILLFLLLYLVLYSFRLVRWGGTSSILFSIYSKAAYLCSPLCQDFLFIAKIFQCCLPTCRTAILERTTAQVILITIGLLLCVGIVANLYTWAQMLQALVFSQRRHLQRAIAHLDTLKSEGFLQALRSEVNLMTEMVRIMI